MKYIIIAIFCIFCSLILQTASHTNAILQVIRICTLAYGFMTLGYGLMRKHVRKSNAIAYYTGVIIMVIFTIITLDTYLFHTLLCIPGIIRYPLYSLYGFAYIFFVLPGILLAYHEQKENQAFVE